MKNVLNHAAKSLLNLGGGISQHKSASIIAGQFSHRKWYSTFILLLLLTFGVGNAWAVNWASLGSEVVANGEYYIYNVNQGKFMIEKALSGAEEAICFKAEASSGKFKFKYGTKYINRPTNTWGTSGILYVLNQYDETNHRYYFIRQRNPDPQHPTVVENYYYKASSATTIAESDADATPDADCQWVFIPKATFDANKWFAAAATVEAGGEYYIYNVGKGQFLKFQATTDKLGEAIPFTVANASSGKFYLRCTNDNKTWAIQTNNSWYKGNNGTACVLEATDNVYNIIRARNDMELGLIYYYYSAKASDNLFEELEGEANATVYSQWLFIPSASFDAFVPAADKEIDREDEWTDVSVAAPTSNDFYYLYNPASQCFLGKNGATANPGVSTDPERATMFYVKKSSSTYGFGYTDQASQKYIGTSTNAATSVAYFTPEETSTNRYHLQKSGTYFYVNMSGSSPAFAVGATPNEYSRWVFIPRAAYVSKMAAAAASAPTDKWLAKAVSPGEGGLFYIYNPASKRFMNNKSLATQDSYATLYHVSKTAANTYAIMYLSDLINGEQITYVDAATITNSWQGSSKMNLTATSKSTSGKTNRYMLNRIKSSVNYYLVSSKTSNTNYTLNIIKNDNNNYKYVSTSGVTEGDMWNEWMFIPATAFEEEIATAPSEPDTWGSQGSAPEIGRQYFLYNVEAQRFFKHAALTTNQEEAVLCTIGGTNEDKSISFINPSNGTTQYVIANLSGGYSATSYSLDWDETVTDSKQYYIYHQMTDEMGPQLGMDPTYDYQIHLRSNKTYTAPDAVAIQTGERPADINGKFKWAFIEPAATLYYSASTEVYEGQGDVYVYFGTPSLSASTGVLSTGSLSESVVKTATFMANPASGYQFMGWKTDPDGDFISTALMYEHELTVSSTDSEHPDNITLYAYFEKYDAEVFDKDGISQGEYETFAAALTAASKGYTIKLKRNITDPLTINKGVTIDFNGYTISGTENNVVTVSAPSTDSVTFVDGSINQEGGVELRICTSSATNAIKVTSGTLVINSGHYTAFQCWNQSGIQAYVINRTGGNVRINGGYFRSYTQDMTTALWTQRYQKYIFNGSNIKLYGGYFAGNSDVLQEVWKFNDTYTLPIVSDNVGLYVGEDMELVNNPVADPQTDVYIYRVQSAFDEALVVATANGKKFSSLADAIAYANNNSETEMVIRLAKDCSLPAGNYVIPAKATLIVPYNAMHTDPLIACPLLNNSRLPSAAYRTLTLENGARIDVYGAIELGGCAYSYGNGATGTGRPNSDYGHMIMNEGSRIILNNGSNLRAWGFVTGGGAIDVRRGARVDEMFQVYDFKGGRGTLAMYENGGHKAFPMNQYFIQNVEVKTTYRPGSALYTTMAAVNVGIAVKIIGVDTDGAALFKMDETDDSEDTWVRKWYNPGTDQQVYDINNSASISNLFLPLSKVIGVDGADFDSKDYILPITNNFKIHVLSGQIDITQDVAFLPGAELEINKLCYGNIKANTTTYFYDSDEWGTYVYNGAYASKIKYRPGGLQYNRNISSAAGLGDAKMNIHGTLEVDGGFRTTEHGANIFSTNEDAGTVSFTANSLTTYSNETLDTWTGQIYHPASVDNDYKASAEPLYIALAAYPAQLQNAEGFTSTTTAAVGDNEGKSFCYINNEWRLLTDEDCMVTDGDNYYIKPQEYIQLSSNTEDANHLYHNVGNTRDFIITLDADGNCQWWEVEDVAGHPELKHSIHPENDVYYYYDAEIYGTWLEKRFTIAWRNWDGSLIENYEMKMGAKLQYLGSTPSREKTDYYTYDFAGWNPAVPEDAVVTGDATYTAQFNQTDRKYLITFKNENAMLGALIDESQYLKMGEMPTLPDLGIYASMLTWTPTVSPVTGDANYTLTMANPLASSFTITFVNWDGSELQSGSVNVGETPVYEGETPIKPSLGDENYTFIGWTPSIAAATADAVYMATYEASHVSGLNISTSQTISDNREVTDLRVTTTGSLNVTGSITANNFYLESNGSSASGQIVGGEDNITADHIYFDYKVNAKNHKWYAVAVPWQVDATSGISVNGKTLTLGTDFDIIYYDGERRAAEGKQKCWKYVENDGDKTLQPGRLYMIGLMSDAATIRFAKKSGASLLTTSTSVTAYSGAAAADDQGWNGVANPALFHAYVNPGVTAGQVYNPETNSYDPILMNDAKFVVGQGAFVEVEDDKAITVSYGGTYAAPRRARAEEAPLMDVRIAPAEAEYTDRLFVTVDEEKAETGYVVGKDLAKLGVSKSVAQMWINRYDAQLCLNTVAPVNGVAEYPLSIFAPKAGEYMITINNSQFTMHNADYALYLTLNGRVIWNLSYAPYTATLEKGTTTTYGLRLILQAPQQKTDIDEAIVDAKGETRKVLINDKVYIIRGNEVYTLDGRLVK